MTGGAVTVRPTADCVRCRSTVPRRGVSWPEGFVCNRCYQQATRRHGPCPGCAEQRLLPGLTPAGPTCTDCAGLGKDFHCTRCQQEDEPHRKGLCARCCLREDLTDLLDTNARQVPAPLGPVVEALIGQDRPRSAIIWLRNPEVRRLLVAFADGTLPLTHDTFDALGTGRTVMHLRELFVRYDALPERSRHVLQFQGWLTRELPRHSPAAATHLQAFATWHHLRRMRHLADAGTLKPGTIATARQQVTVAGQLLTHLETTGIHTAQVRQEHLDAWLASGPTTRYTARTFVVWAVRNGHLPTLTFPHRRNQTTPLLSQDTRLTLLRHFLQPTEPAPTTTRLAAVLLLLFAQPMTRICRLRIDDLDTDGPITTLRLGPEPAPLPDVVDDLLKQHLAQRRNTFTAANANSPWLFPGASPGQPLHQSYLMTLVRDAGVDLRGARNSALRQLVLDMPPAVAATVLGYSATITSQHARNAGQDFASYPTVRPQPPPRGA